MSEVNEMATEPLSRNFSARTGIALLNLIHPGLGLFRILQWRFGIIFVILPLCSTIILFISYRLVDHMTFNRYFGLLSIALTIYLMSIIGSILLTWKNSQIVAHQPPRWSRWYGLVSIVFIMVTATFPLPDHLRSYYKGFSMPSESMQPTFNVGDKFLAKMFDFDQIKRGDILLVRTKTSDFVKRVIALPGDTVALKKGILFVNGTAVAQRLLETRPNNDPLAKAGRMQILSEQLPGEIRPHRITDLGVSPADDWQETKLGPDEYFFLGDNRDKSADSRFTIEVMGLGIVSKKRIVGRPLFRYWRAGIGYKEGAI